eukprot:2155335-Prymnesium_polylepis.1
MPDHLAARAVPGAHGDAAVAIRARRRHIAVLAVFAAFFGLVLTGSLSTLVALLIVTRLICSTAAASARASLLMKQETTAHHLLCHVVGVGAIVAARCKRPVLRWRIEGLLKVERVQGATRIADHRKRLRSGARVAAQWGPRERLAREPAAAARFPQTGHPAFVRREPQLTADCRGAGERCGVFGTPREGVLMSGRGSSTGRSMEARASACSAASLTQHSWRALGRRRRADAAEFSSTSAPEPKVWARSCSHRGGESTMAASVAQEHAIEHTPATPSRGRICSHRSDGNSVTSSTAGASGLSSAAVASGEMCWNLQRSPLLHLPALKNLHMGRSSLAAGSAGASLLRSSSCFLFSRSASRSMPRCSAYLRISLARCLDACPPCPGVHFKSRCSPSSGAGVCAWP